MQTIEKRAHEYGLDCAGGNVYEGTKGMIYAGRKEQYIKIATEQKQIDIEQTKTFLKTFLPVLTESTLVIEAYLEFMKMNEQ